MKKVLGAGIAASALLVGIALANPNKVEVCHVTSAADNPFVIIKISEKAFPAHAEHGDFLLPESGVCEDNGGGGDPN